MAAKIIHDDNFSWFQCWHEELLDICGEAFAFDRTIEYDAGRINPVMAQRGQERHPAPIPVGSFGAKPVPFAQPPRKVAILVLGHVSSIKTGRWGSCRFWYFFHCARRRAAFGRSCSDVRRLFFEALPFGLNKSLNGPVIHVHSTPSQLGHRPVQREVRFRRPL